MGKIRAFCKTRYYSSKREGVFIAFFHPFLMEKCNILYIFAIF